MSRLVRLASMLWDADLPVDHSRLPVVKDLSVTARSRSPVASIDQTCLRFQKPPPPLTEPKCQNSIPRKNNNMCLDVPSVQQNTVSSLDCQHKHNRFGFAAGHRGAIHVHTLKRKDDKRPLAGEILHHCVAGIQALRSKCGGDELAVFKIGLVGQWSNIGPRWDSYDSNGWARMHVLFFTWCLEQAELLEAACINAFEETTVR